MTALLTGAALRKSVAYRKVDLPKPIIPPACRNCAEYRCDHNDMAGEKGIYFQIVNSRCVLHKFTVQRNTVCDSHMFAHNDYLMPADKGMKLVELLQSAFEARRDYGDRGFTYALGEQPSVELSLVKASQIKARRADTNAAGQMLLGGPD